MPIDFDTIVNRHLEKIYGTDMSYSPLVSAPGAPPVSLRAIFDRHHELIMEDIAKSERQAPGHSTTAPVITVRLADFAATPKQDDQVVIAGETFNVWDVQPDGEGCADLILREI